MSHLSQPGAIAQVISGEIAYTEFSAAVTISSTTEASPNDVVSAGAITFDGSTIIVIEFQCVRLQTSSTAGSIAVLNLWDASTDLGRLASVNNNTPTSGAVGASVHPARRLTPSAGSHTYRVRAWSTAGVNGTVAAGAGGTATDLPGFIRICRV